MSGLDDLVDLLHRALHLVEHDDMAGALACIDQVMEVVDGAASRTLELRSITLRPREDTAPGRVVAFPRPVPHPGLASSRRRRASA